MKWGAKQRAWQKIYDAGRDPPAAFYDLDPPQVWPWLQGVWLAFAELGTERQIGMGLGPIPSSKIRDYAVEIAGLDPMSEASDCFYDLIRRMDDEYRADQDKKSDSGRTEIKPDDAVGVGLLFKKIENRKKHQKKIAQRKERSK